jgi:hypothetical protein
MGIGWGSLSAEVDDKDLNITGDVTGTGVSVELAFGGTVAPGLVIGAGIYGTSVASPEYESNGLKSDGGQVVASMLGPFLDWYFDPHSGAHFQAAVGYTAITAEQADSDPYPSQDSSGGGFGVMVGAGYEFWIGDQWSLGPLGRLHYMSGEVEGDDTGGKADVSGTVFSVLLSATYH